MPLDAAAVQAALAGRFADFYSQYADLRPCAGELRGRCPVHGGDNPQAFAVRPEDGFWICHTRGCGKPGGDVFSFLMEKDGLTFPEALAQAAAFAGVSEAPALRPPPRPRPVPAPRPEPLDPGIADDLHRRLMDCPPMRVWLSEERGLATETLTRFRLGLHRDERDGGFYRVTFPVYDRAGRLMNLRRHLFAYRRELTEERRKSLGKTKSWREAGNWLDLFPLAALGGATEALIVEGEADAALACQLGFAAVTGTSGAASWKGHWTEELRGLARVTVLYDTDRAGQEGARRVAAAVSQSVPDVRIAHYGALLVSSNKRGCL